MPEEFGRYELQDLLGRGGMGEVYRAFDTVRERTVALKLLPKHLAVDESFKARFRRESRMAAKLNEPHIVPIHDFGEIDGRLFIDMRLVDGRDLGTVIAESTMPNDTAVNVVGQVAAALDAAHASGLVHRDVKPSNVLLTGDDPGNPFVYLVDFGIARSATEEGTSLTATTGTVGTIAYMSPERIAGEPGDRRTDVYALACVMYEMLTGRKPYEGELFAIMYAHVNTPVPAMSALAPGVPAGLDAVVRKGMAKVPDERYQTAGALAAAARIALRSAAAAPPAPPGRVPPSPLSQAPPSQAPPSPPPPPLGRPIEAARPGGSEGPPRSALPAPSGPPVQQGTGEPGRRPATPVPPGQHHHSGPTPPPPMGPPRGPAGSAPQSLSTGRPTATPSGPLPGGWTPPTHSGPIGPPGFTGPTPPATKKRNILIAAIAAVVVIAVAITLVLVLHKSGSPQAGPGPSTGPTTPGPITTPTPKIVTTLDTGPASNTPTWAHFASFSKLVGTKDNDTPDAFRGAVCKDGVRDTNVKGLVDEVTCDLASGDVQINIGRFSSASIVQAYVHDLTDNGGYSVAPWTMAGVPSGLSYVSPSTDKPDITTMICGLPNYLVELVVPTSSSITAASLHDNYWDEATFPDVIPPACNSKYTAIAAGAKSAAGAVAAKPSPTLNPDTLAQLLQGGQTGIDTFTVETATTIEGMELGQTGKVSFWSWSEAKQTLVKVGSSTYPYAPSSLGPPDAKASGALLTSMSHATFVVTGTFSGDGSGNAVAYTYGPKGWGAIKAENNGNLAPSGAGVGVSGIGLSQSFGLVNGLLMTADCSSKIPIAQCGGNSRVIKYWKWRTTSNEFVLDHTAGRSS